MDQYDQQGGGSTSFESGSASEHAARPGGAVEAAAPAGSSEKADLSKRFLAALIDGVIAAAVGWIPGLGGILAAGYMLARDGVDHELMPRRSIGKKAMGLAPVRVDGRPMDLETSARRNWMFALGGLTSLLLVIPIIGWLLMIPVLLAALALSVTEVVLVLTDGQGRRLGDRMAGTVVRDAGG